MEMGKGSSDDKASKRVSDEADIDLITLQASHMLHDFIRKFRSHLAKVTFCLTLVCTWMHK